MTNRITECIIPTTLSFLIKGKRDSPFKLEQGICQGPYVTLYLYYLSRRFTSMYLFYVNYLEMQMLRFE